jgi:hypothetical protein
LFPALRKKVPFRVCCAVVRSVALRVNLAFQKLGGDVAKGNIQRRTGAGVVHRLECGCPSWEETVEVVIPYKHEEASCFSAFRLDVIASPQWVLSVEVTSHDYVWSGVSVQ